MNNPFEYHQFKNYKSIICFIFSLIFSLSSGIAQILKPAENVLLYKSNRFSNKIMIQSIHNLDDTLFIVHATIVSLKDSIYNENRNNQLLNYFRKIAQIGNKNEIDTRHRLFL
jgi:hypothetical protein